MTTNLSLTIHQIDTIHHSLNRSMALARLVGNGPTARQPGCHCPQAMDLFHTMELLLEELEKIKEINQGLGKKSSQPRAISAGA